MKKDKFSDKLEKAIKDQNSLSVESQKTIDQFGNIAKIMLPIMRLSYPNLVASELVDIQPMRGLGTIEKTKEELEEEIKVDKNKKFTEKLQDKIEGKIPSMYKKDPNYKEPIFYMKYKYDEPKKKAK